MIWHRNDLHFAFHEIKQRQIFFQHEENKLIFVRVGQEGPEQRKQIRADAGLAALDIEVEMPPAFRALGVTDRTGK